MNQNHQTTQDRSEYRTGALEPVKQRSGLVVALLIVVAVLAGVVTILSVMNVRLFAQLHGQKSGALSLQLQPTNRAEKLQSPTESTVPAGEVIQLQPVPDRNTNGSATEELTLQQIYSQCVDSVVSVTCGEGASASHGTGVVLTGDGYIVTNAHVVQQARAITVQLNDGRQLDGALVGCDSPSDLAVVRVQAQDLTAAQFGTSDGLQVGEAICSIGNLLGAELRGTLTDGILCGINQTETADGRPVTLLQTNAATHSGSPLFNSYGQIIGITAQVDGRTGNGSVTFAVPSALVKNVVDQLISQGYVSGRPCVGITGEEVSEVYQYLYQLPEGLFITDITLGSDAEAKGLAQGDILISVDGEKITSLDALTQALYDYEVGDVIQVEIFRNNKHYIVELTVEEG